MGGGITLRACQRDDAGGGGGGGAICESKRMFTIVTWS